MVNRDQEKKKVQIKKRETYESVYSRYEGRELYCDSKYYLLKNASKTTISSY